MTTALKVGSSAVHFGKAEQDLATGMNIGRLEASDQHQPLDDQNTAEPCT